MQPTSLAPILLLAAPRLEDSNFERAVVLIGRHEEDGSLGWILNGPALAPVGELLKSADLVPADLQMPKTQAFGRQARIGGPVSPRSGWLLYPRRLRSFEHELDVGDELAVCNHPEALEAVIRGQEPREFRLLLGYAGWGPGQLEKEMKDGAWFPVDLDPVLLLQSAPEGLWDAAFQKTTGVSPTTFNGRLWAKA